MLLIIPQFLIKPSRLLIELEGFHGFLSSPKLSYVALEIISDPSSTLEAYCSSSYIIVKWLMKLPSCKFFLKIYIPTHYCLRRL